MPLNKKQTNKTKSYCRWDLVNVDSKYSLQIFQKGESLVNDIKMHLILRVQFWGISSLSLLLGPL